MPRLSAIVITKNEAAKIEACLDSLAFCDERIVVDSGSTDATVALAEAKPIEEAAAFANAAAAIKCRRPGGRRGAPTRPEVETLLQAVAS